MDCFLSSSISSRHMCCIFRSMARVLPRPLRAVDPVQEKRELVVWPSASSQLSMDLSSLESSTADNSQSVIGGGVTQYPWRSTPQSSNWSPSGQQCMALFTAGCRRDPHRVGRLELDDAALANTFPKSQSESSLTLAFLVGDDVAGSSSLSELSGVDRSL